MSNSSIWPIVLALRVSVDFLFPKSLEQQPHHQIVSFLYESFWDCTKHTNQNCYPSFSCPIVFFSSFARSWDLPLFFCFLLIILSGLPGRQSPVFRRFTFFFLSNIFLLFTITSSGGLVKIRWSVRISKLRWNLRVTFSKTDSGLCICKLFIWSNINFLHNSQWIAFPTQSFLFFALICCIRLLCYRSFHSLY